MHTRSRILTAIALTGTALSLSVSALADSVSDAQAFVDEITKPNPSWTGPTTGPEAQPDKTIVYVSTDQRNGGALGVGEGVEEAAETIGWTFRLIDGQGGVSGRSPALHQHVVFGNSMYTRKRVHTGKMSARREPFSSCKRLTSSTPGLCVGTAQWSTYC